MTNTQNPNWLFRTTHYDRSSWPYQATSIDVFKGETYPLGNLRTGTQVTINGERAVIMVCHNKNTLVRFRDTQECVMVPNVVEATVHSYGGHQDCGIPKVGEFVQVRKGEHKDKVGMVFTEGLHSTYVVFPDDRDRGHKFAARDLIVREDVSILKTY